MPHRCRLHFPGCYTALPTSWSFRGRLRLFISARTSEQHPCGFRMTCLPSSRLFLLNATRRARSNECEQLRTNKSNIHRRNSMRVFVTGATGFIGSRVVQDLIAAGHKVLGLSRSDSGAEFLTGAGAEVQRGTLEDLDSLRNCAAASDAVIHCAFNHDFSKFVENCEADRKAIEAIGEVLQGSKKPLIVTSGLALLAHGRAANEDDPPAPVSAAYPRASEHAAAALEDRGVNAMVIRLPQIHDTRKQGFVTSAIQVARAKGFSAYVGDGENRWAAAHLLDAAKVYLL